MCVTHLYLYFQVFLPLKYECSVQPLLYGLDDIRRLYSLRFSKQRIILFKSRSSKFVPYFNLSSLALHKKQTKKQPPQFKGNFCTQVHDYSWYRMQQQDFFFFFKCLQRNPHTGPKIFFISKWAGPFLFI